MCSHVHMIRRTMPLILKEKDWHYIDNTPEEIVAAVDEMLKRLTNLWRDSNESEKLQKKFWQQAPIELLKRQIHIGDDFIKNYQSLLN